jgi:DNA-binding response OmpR family regulator
MAESHILIVEDDYDLIETYTDLLEAQEYHVTSASNVVDTLKLIRQRTPDLVILDLNLPDACGFNVINAIRSSDSLMETIIVVVTGHAEMTGVSDQADIVLTKPVSNQQLLTIIKRYLTQKPKVSRKQTGRLPLLSKSE